jgi:GNAT superfamily N-acetyltransferase
MRYLVKAQQNDIEEIMGVIRDAQAMMAMQGSGQWQDGTPARATILHDIKDGHFYVAKDDEIIIGVMAFLDYDPEYQNLLTGAWHYGPRYKVIHRFAIKGSHRQQGVGSFLLKEAETIAKAQGVDTIRIDTHEKNIPMTKLLEKNGYQAVGTVILEKIKLRTAFEKLLR